MCFQNQFIEKNNDALHASLEFLVQESNSALVQQLFQTSDNNNAKGKLNFISVGAKFQSQLSQLMDKLKENVSIYLLFMNGWPKNPFLGFRVRQGTLMRWFSPSVPVYYSVIKCIKFRIHEHILIKDLNFFLN